MSRIWQWIKSHPYISTSIVITTFLLYRWKSIKPVPARGGKYNHCIFEGLTNLKGGSRQLPSTSTSTSSASTKSEAPTEVEDNRPVIQRNVVLSPDEEGEDVPVFDVKAVFKGDTISLTSGILSRKHFSSSSPSSLSPLTSYKT